MVWECSKKDVLRNECAALGVTMPVYATRKQLQAVLDDYYEKAAAFISESGLPGFQQTYNPVAEYEVDYTLKGSIIVRAESEEAARKWANEELMFGSHPSKYIRGNVSSWKLGKSRKYEEDLPF